MGRQVESFSENKNEAGLLIGDEGGGDDAEVVAAGDASVVGDLLIVYPGGDPAFAGFFHQRMGDAATGGAIEEHDLTGLESLVGDGLGDDPGIGWNEGLHGEAGAAPRLRIFSGASECFGAFAEGAIDGETGGGGVIDGEALNVRNGDGDGAVLASGQQGSQGCGGEDRAKSKGGEKLGEEAQGGSQVCERRLVATELVA